MRNLYLILLITLYSNVLRGQFDPHLTKLDSLQELKEVTVVYQANKLTPITFQNLTGEQISVVPIAKEPSFLLSETPSVTNYSDAGSYQGYSYFRIRGIDQTRINVTLDGIPLNEPEDQGSYLANYPDLLNSIGGIQIQRGVGLTKNGAGNYAGNIELSSPNLNDKYTEIKLGYGSYNTAAATIEYNNGKSLYVRGSRAYSDGYKHHSSNNASSLFLSTGLFGEKSNWRLNAFAGEHKNGQAWIGVSQEAIDLDRRTNGNSKAEDDHFKILSTQLQNSWFNENSFFQFSTYYCRLDGNYNFDLGNYLGVPDIQELYNYDFLSNLVGLYGNYTYEVDNFKVTSGVHGNLYNRRHLGSERSYGQLYENTGYKNELSTFAKVQYSIRDLTFFTDIQYRYVTFDYKGDVEFDEMDWSFVNPKLGVSCEVGNGVLYYTLGQSGREPTRNDMFGGNDNLPQDTLGNPILIIKDSERVFDQELGYRVSFDKVTCNLNLYYMQFRNEIVLDGMFGPNGLALTNSVDQSIRSGVELSFNYEVIRNWTLINNSSFNYSNIKDQGLSFKPILTPSIIVNQELQYSKSGITGNIGVRYQDQSYINFANSEVIKDYLLVNLRLSYDITKNLQVTGYINNLTNIDYVNNGYVDSTPKYFVQAPINFYLGIKYRI